MTDEERRACELALINATEKLANAARYLGMEHARDVLTDHLSQHEDEASSEWLLILAGISDTLRRSQEAREGCDRWVSFYDSTKGTEAHFAWDSEDRPMSPEYAAAMANALRTWTGASTPGTTLPLPVGELRRWSVDQHVGDVFTEDDDYDGFALTIEIKDAAEAQDVEHCLSRGVWDAQEGGA